MIATRVARRLTGRTFTSTSSLFNIDMVAEHTFKPGTELMEHPIDEPSKGILYVHVPLLAYFLLKYCHSLIEGIVLRTIQLYFTNFTDFNVYDIITTCSICTLLLATHICFKNMVLVTTIVAGSY